MPTVSALCVSDLSLLSVHSLSLISIICWLPLLSSGVFVSLHCRTSFYHVSLLLVCSDVHLCSVDLTVSAVCVPCSVISHLTGLLSSVTSL
ncbi:hypothetical protein AVEN_131519-1 [Araneus ventricosus]|uniref:Uncharacterized protein n=1 Tax=Araneus ventricosus TaxID=182803 RepID=A0A4Y2VVB4_ARAVE|nr:hypothetical protein AVEN_131519-1 [Araneus ventricosus]